MRKTLQLIGRGLGGFLWLLSLPIRWIGYGIAWCFRWLRKPWKRLPGSKAIAKAYASAPLRAVRKTIFALTCVIVWLVILVGVGVLGPIVRLAAPPVAATLGYRLSIGTCVICPFANTIRIADLRLDTEGSPRIGTDAPLVSLSRLDCAPFSGYARLEGLRVENPDAFTADKYYAENGLLTLGLAEADLDVPSLLTDTITVELIRIHGIRALYAFANDTTNVDALIAQLVPQKPAAEPAPEAASPEPAPAPEEPATPAKPAKAKDIQIALVDFEDNIVTIRSGISIPIPLPAMRLENIDSRDLKTRLEAVSDTVKKSVDGVKKGLGAIGDGAAKLYENASTLIDDGAKDAGSALSAGAESVDEALSSGAESVGEAIKGLRGIFRKKD